MHAQRRSLLLMLVLPGVAPAARAADEAAATLRPGESIELPGLSLKVLGVDWKRGAVITFRLRALTPVGKSASIGAPVLRLFVAGVPRAASGWYGLNVAPESAEDFSVEFPVSERTDDVVLQVRYEGAVERRRIAAK